MHSEVSHNDLIKHIDHLVEAYNLKVETAYNPADSYARRSVRTVCIPFIVDIETYFTCLHEIAHCVYSKAWYGTTLDIECHAWLWAYENSIISADKKCIEMVENSLVGYYNYVKVDRRFKYDVDLFVNTIFLFNGIKENNNKKETNTAAQKCKTKAA